MKATIKRIDNLKHGNGTEFKRVYFETAAGHWAKTDLCPAFRNWPRWRDLLEVGVILDDLVMLDDVTVDADSHPRLIFRPPKQTELF
jgi:hypothetical protein